MSGVPAWRAAALRLPIMIPAAVAVVAVLMVATQTWLTPPGPRSLTRSVAIPQHVRVTALGAPVRRQPNGHAEVIAMVTRGMVVDVGGEERDWLHVTLPNGTDGWVEQRALR
jgi:SH3-like domain-containing protein